MVASEKDVTILYACCFGGELQSYSINRRESYVHELFKRFLDF